MTLDKNKVLLGFSGGVDSTATALILKENGYEVHGLFLDVHGNSTETQKKASRVAQQLNIPLMSLDVSQYFKEKVMDYLYNEYIQGYTPNPCIECNKYIKFNLMLEEAQKIGAYYIATGHYARIEHNPTIGEYIIKKPKALAKDQTYMLYNLNQDILKHVLFPLGDIESKDEVREMVEDSHLSNAKAKDSQEICFIEDNDYVNFIENNYGYKSIPGQFIDAKGNVLGEHKGIINYTIGQRKGLGIALGEPAYVTKINSKKNTVTLGKNEDLFKPIVYSKNNHFINSESFIPKEIEAKIRYSAKPTKAIIEKENQRIKTTFETPQRAITTGQSIVFYSGDILLGGGIII